MASVRAQPAMGGEDLGRVTPRIETFFGWTVKLLKPTRGERPLFSALTV